MLLGCQAGLLKIIMLKIPVAFTLPFGLNSRAVLRLIILLSFSIFLVLKKKREEFVLVGAICLHP